LKKTFSDLFPAEDSSDTYNAFDIIGDIAITKLPTHSPAKAEEIAKAIMSVHKSVKAVFIQSSAVAGDFRLRSLTHVAGENRTRTFHKESGCSFAVDVETCYFSPRLMYERRRIAKLVKPNEIVINMFAGVGCFSIIIAKRSESARVFSIDMNPAAIQFMQENIRLNRVYGRVTPLFGDAKTIIENRLQQSADRVLMPLPEKAFKYLPCAVSALKVSGGWIHYHDFEHATKTEDPREKVKLKVSEKLASLNVGFEVPFSRVIRTVGPNWHHIAVDIHVAR
jgi:tRNA (guanine37-N1)-methyltransferase